MVEQETYELDMYRKSLDMHTIELLDTAKISLQRYERVYIMNDDDDVRKFEYAFINANELYQSFNHERIVAIFENKGYIDVMAIAYLEGEGQFIGIWRIKYW